MNTKELIIKYCNAEINYNNYALSHQLRKNKEYKNYLDTKKTQFEGFKEMALKFNDNIKDYEIIGQLNAFINCCNMGIVSALTKQERKMYGIMLDCGNDLLSLITKDSEEIEEVYEFMNMYC